MTTDTRTRLAPRIVDARAGTGGAVDEYTALQGAAMDRLVRCGLEATAARVRLRDEVRRLAEERGLDDDEIGRVVAPLLEATEAALAEVHDEFCRLTLHVLRMGRYRLGLC
jgi:hypothetical protein